MKYFSTTESPVLELIEPTDPPRHHWSNYPSFPDYQSEYPTNQPGYWSDEPITNLA